VEIDENTGYLYGSHEKSGSTCLGPIHSDLLGFKTGLHLRLYFHLIQPVPVKMAAVPCCFRPAPAAGRQPGVKSLSMDTPHAWREENLR
jgi:hypothetical protein